jgi:hypothetical protein
MPELNHAVLPPEPSAPAKGFLSALHHVCDKVSLDIASIRSRHRSVILHPRSSISIRTVCRVGDARPCTPDSHTSDRRAKKGIVLSLQNHAGNQRSVSPHNQPETGPNGPVWQEESFDHVLRSSGGLDVKAEYVLQNPVRNGLVADWREYPWAWQRQDQPIAEMKSVASQNV